MGNDGGSIPSRRELVKEAARNPSATELKESQHSQQEYYWTTDPLSQKPLAAPIVSDCNGKLYNKDSIIEHLLPSEDEVKKSEAEDVLQGAVNSLKDVVDVKFTVDPSLEGEMTGSTKIAQWICPITNERLGAGAKAVYVVPCGHAFSANAVKEVSGELCMTAVGNKKRKKVAEATELKKDGDMVPRTASPAHKSRDVGIKNASTASLTAKVMEEQDLRNKRRKHEGNNNLKGLFSARDSTRSSGANSDFMTRGFSIPANDKR
ncbi:MAG: hypothetical protein Q9157_002518 [Trypethelium eluteriae]